MAKMIPLVFQGIKRLILDLPPGASAAHKMKDIFFGDGQIGDPGEMLHLPGLAVLFPVFDKAYSFIRCDLLSGVLSTTRKQ